MRGNTCGALSGSGTVVLSGNVCGAIDIVSGCIVRDCTISGHLFGTSSNVLTGNRISNSLSLSGTGNTVCGNKCQSVNLGSGNVARGNTASSTLSVTSSNVLSGNRCVGAITGNATNAMAGNQTSSGLTLSGASNVLSCNLIASDLQLATAPKDNILFANNVAGAIKTAAAGFAPTPTICIASIVPNGGTIFTTIQGTGSIQNTPAVGASLNSGA